jgi:hypothetical protein
MGSFVDSSRVREVEEDDEPPEIEEDDEPPEVEKDDEPPSKQF